MTNMHLIILAEAIERNHERFKAWMTNHQFTTGGHPIIREIKLYDINIKESDLPRFMDMLIPSEVNFAHEGKILGSKFSFLTRIVSKFLPIKSLEKEKADARKRIKDGTSAHQPEPWDWFYLYIIGKMDDGYDKFSVEKI